MNRLTVIPRSLLRTHLCKLSKPAARITPVRGVLAGVPQRTFTASAFLSKKGSNSKKDKHAAEEAPASSSSPSAAAETVDFDVEFKKLESEIARIEDRLRDDLAKLRAGRAEPSLLEGLPVTLDKAAGSSAPLRDVAHVVSKGRGLAVTVYEAANVKRVVSAIQLADLNLQPVVDAQNPQVVNVPLPPPTKMARDANSKKAAQLLHKALDALKNTRLVTHKKIMGVRKLRPDDVKKGEKKMEAIIKDRKKEMEDTVAAAQKEILQG
ncbi:ribosome recycling factor-domain-containing protein [Sphaerosporella brunnea]|uniref:Ribosome recycling factor-domain-containing protein n=1 Tax=Sphaerosporella brunnea TaxID=1250544 RepID=A0A5J5EGS4_9PEZI|nr:ribosome recycling factor-domain-containing protein [Sphaerosporella brunnea]